MNQSDSRPQLEKAAPASPCRVSSPETIPADPVGPLWFRRRPSIHDAVHDPGGASPSRIATAHMLPSFDGKNSASANFHISGLTTVPCMAPVYASDPALPRRPQDSVPACPLQLWPDETFTHKSSTAFPNALRQCVDWECSGSGHEAAGSVESLRRLRGVIDFAAVRIAAVHPCAAGAPLRGSGG